MGIKQVKLSVNELTIGMYVSGLDRPWTQTPFPLQGFYIRDIDELKRLKSLCNHVYIDVVKGRSPVATKLRSYDGVTGGGKGSSARHVATAPVNVPVKPIKVRRNLHPDIKPLGGEVKKARDLHQKVYSAVADVLSQLDAEKFYDIPVAETRRLASDMVDSVLRNPDAFTWLSRVQEADEYTYSHALRSSVWAILFGRHIGLEKRELDILAMGVLLKDVGKTKLPHELIIKSDRSPDEQEQYESFVELGVALLKSAEGMEPRVVSVVRTHCERLNGSGFPQHLVGDKIPLLGKIAGIVTFYDTVITPRGASVPIAPSKAVARLYELRNVQFQEDLVVEFIRAIGLYPTGTLVELNTGEVGVVVEQNFDRRLKPKVMIVIDALKQPLKTPKLLDLAIDDRTKQSLIDSGKVSLEDVQKVEIARDLEPGSFDVDIIAIRDNYLLATEKKGLLALLGRFKR
ncbi:HD-GYP domain-containing protein [Gilvimarinus polysaccharolyticus]|uniref:HD-GYP domain-containing protein n=1 Tax=Gilvimarinus polysaccharolyticus TaxID=863921 RepID=UPI0006731829|nr:HD-GYP domain-containing protein [Gilvimarinus polysaccharolyticus]